MKLRTGRHNGRTLYLQTGEQPDRDEDLQIGTVDTEELGALVVESVNALLDEQAIDTLRSLRPALHL